MSMSQGSARPCAVRAVSVPRPRCKKWPVIDVPDKVPIRLQIVNAQAFDTFTHWAGKTVACTAPDADRCWLDHKEVGAPRYYLFVACVELGLEKVHLCRLTMKAVDEEPRLRDEDLDLRGLELHAWREWNYDHSEMHARLFVHGPRRVELPPEIDLEFAVNRLLQAPRRNVSGEPAKPGPMARALAATKRRESAGRPVT